MIHHPYKWPGCYRNISIREQQRVAQNKDINKVVEINHGIVRVAIKILLSIIWVNFCI